MQSLAQFSASIVAVALCTLVRVRGWGFARFGAILACRYSGSLEQLCIGSKSVANMCRSKSWRVSRGADDAPMEIVSPASCTGAVFVLERCLASEAT